VGYGPGRLSWAGSPYCLQVAAAPALASPVFVVASASGYSFPDALLVYWFIRSPLGWFGFCRLSWSFGPVPPASRQGSLVILHLPTPGAFDPLALEVEGHPAVRLCSIEEFIEHLVYLLHKIDLMETR